MCIIVTFSSTAQIGLLCLSWTRGILSVILSPGLVLVSITLGAGYCFVSAVLFGFLWMQRTCIELKSSECRIVKHLAGFCCCTCSTEREKIDRGKGSNWPTPWPDSTECVLIDTKLLEIIQDRFVPFLRYQVSRVPVK